MYHCSDDRYWSCHGGVPALERELAKCQSLCCWCHRLKTKRERGIQKKKCRLKRRAIINAEKLRRGKCLRCPRRVTLETCCAFDFDHRDASTKVVNVSQLIKKSQAFFDQHIENYKKLLEERHASMYRMEDGVFSPNPVHSKLPTDIVLFLTPKPSLIPADAVCRQHIRDGVIDFPATEENITKLMQKHWKTLISKKYVSGNSLILPRHIVEESL